MPISPPDLQTFLKLPTADVAELVRAHGLRTCGYPINGTRRWFLAERAYFSEHDLPDDYLGANMLAHLRQYRLFFEHGVYTLLTPGFGPDLLRRGADYVAVAMQGVLSLTTHPDLLAFYEAYDVQVRFYGDYEAHLADTPHADVVEALQALQTRTAHHKRHRLFIGLFAHDATETIARLSIAHHQQHGRAPSKAELVQAYYGAPVDPLDLFIGFDKFAVFDTPLLTTGAEDLYFTISPSLYTNPEQLRRILYDHLFLRHLPETDYADLTSDDIGAMRVFYRANQGNALGIGARQPHGDYWYPLPLVTLPPSFEGESKQPVVHTANERNA